MFSPCRKDEDGIPTANVWTAAGSVVVAPWQWLYSVLWPKSLSMTKIWDSQTRDDGG